MRSRFSDPTDLKTLAGYTQCYPRKLWVSEDRTQLLSCSAYSVSHFGHIIEPEKIPLSYRLGNSLLLVFQLSPMSRATARFHAPHLPTSYASI